MMIRLKIQILFLLIFTGTTLLAQETTDSTTVLMKYFDGTDTVYLRSLEEVTVKRRRPFKWSDKRYHRLEKKIKKVYPYAKLAAKELDKYNEQFLNIDDPKAKRQYVKKVEKDFMKKYEDKFRHFTISEGRYLMLLIDRETQHTSFELIKELKGGLPALFWQGIARIFGNNLKEPYDPYEKHFMIEYIVMGIDSGKI